TNFVDLNTADPPLIRDAQSGRRENSPKPRFFNRRDVPMARWVIVTPSLADPHLSGRYPERVAAVVNGAALTGGSVMQSNVRRMMQIAARFFLVLGLASTAWAGGRWKVGDVVVCFGSGTCKVVRPAVSPLTTFR